jgi:hypothetical protein
MYLSDDRCSGAERKEGAQVTHFFSGAAGRFHFLTAASGGASGFAQFSQTSR